MSTAPPAPSPTAPPAPPPIRLRGESEYDRVTSLLMAVVLGTLLIFGYLAVVYATSQAYASRVASPLEIIDVAGGGGTPDGVAGSVEELAVPDADAADLASNNEVDASDFEEPEVMETPATMLDAAADVGELLADLSDPLSGRQVASGKRASRIGTGVPGFGSGTGGGGVGPEDRWSILYNPGQTIDEYARQLDALGVELATIQGSDTLAYVSKFSAEVPTVRVGPARTDERLYFAWQGRGRKESDVALLQKARIDVGDKPILQFYPKGAEQRLARLEVQYRGLQPAEIRVTRFRVVPEAGGYGFEVIDQQPIR